MPGRTEEELQTITDLQVILFGVGERRMGRGTGENCSDMSDGTRRFYMLYLLFTPEAPQGG